jgi:hypothetical protein
MSTTGGLAGTFDTKPAVGNNTDRMRGQSIPSDERRAARLKKIEVQYRALKDALAELGYFCKGTVLSRTMKCGREACPCATDPARRHGPYFEWTLKVDGKTEHHRLSPAASRVYEDATAEHRKLKSLLGRMERLSRQALAELADEK